MVSRGQLMLDLVLKKQNEVPEKTSLEQDLQTSFNYVLNSDDYNIPPTINPILPLIEECCLKLADNAEQNIETAEWSLSCEKNAEINKGVFVIFSESTNSIDIAKVAEETDLDEQPYLEKKKNKNNKKTENRELRMKGESYLGFSKPRGQKNTFQNVVRSGRIIGDRCKCKKGQKGPQNQCYKTSEHQKADIFKRIWSNFNWEERKVFVCNTVTAIDLKGEARRKTTFKYSIKIQEVFVPVCKNMYIATTGIKEWSIQNWVKNSDNMGIKNLPISTRANLRRSDPRLVLMKEFLQNLNKLPSHYCRKDNSKLYLEQNFQTVMDLHRAYVAEYGTTEKEAMCHNVLRNIMKELNIGFYRPKKDWCDTCFKYKSGNLDENEYQVHLLDKDRARAEKDQDKTNGENGLCHMLTMDVQAVNVCPFINASALYYRTKLCCHNFTVFNLATKVGTCYWFDETDSDGQASTYFSCLVDYLEKHFLESGSKIPIIIYSDGCTAQNRNSIMCNAFLYISEKYQVEIIQKYLVKGHPQMECDSVHSTIENKIKNKEIYVPHDYI